MICSAIIGIKKVYEALIADDEEVIEENKVQGSTEEFGDLS